MAGTDKGQVSVVLPTLRPEDVRPAADLLSRSIADRKLSGIWVRDLPSTQKGQLDQGPKIDPFVAITHLQHLLEYKVSWGVAVASMAERTADATLRAATSLTDFLRIPIRLAVGKGRPENPVRPSDLQFEEYVGSLQTLMTATEDDAVYLPRHGGGLDPELWIASARYERLAGPGSQARGVLIAANSPAAVPSIAAGVGAVNAQLQLAIACNIHLLDPGSPPRLLHGPVEAIALAPEGLSALWKRYFESGGLVQELVTTDF